MPVSLHALQLHMIFMACHFEDLMTACSPLLPTTSSIATPITQNIPHALVSPATMSRGPPAVAEAADRSQVQQWHAWGLPKDPTCIDNAVAVSCSQQWPLLMDPHGLARQWLQGLESGGLQVRSGLL